MYGYGECVTCESSTAYLWAHPKHFIRPVFTYSTVELVNQALSAQTKVLGLKVGLEIEQGMRVPLLLIHLGATSTASSLHVGTGH